MNLTIPATSIDSNQNHFVYAHKILPVVIHLKGTNNLTPDRIQCLRGAQCKDNAANFRLSRSIDFFCDNGNGYLT